MDQVLYAQKDIAAMSAQNGVMSAVEKFSGKVENPTWSKGVSRCLITQGTILPNVYPDTI